MAIIIFKLYIAKFDKIFFWCDFTLFTFTKIKLSSIFSIALCLKMKRQHFVKMYVAQPPKVISSSSRAHFEVNLALFHDSWKTHFWHRSTRAWFCRVSPHISICSCKHPRMDYLRNTFKRIPLLVFHSYCFSSWVC